MLYICTQLKQPTMKKLFVLFAAATLFVGVQACKQKEEAATEETTEVTTEVTTDSVVAPVTVDSTTVVVDSTKH